MHPHEVQRITDLLPFFSALSHQDWQSTQLISVDPSTPHQIREGHILEHAMFIVRGTIRIYKINEQGREITLYRVHSGQSCVLMIASILGEAEYEASASIEAESEILLIPVGIFRMWMDNNKPLRQFIYKQFIERINAVTELLENVAFKPMNFRLAQLLFNRTNDTTTTLMITHEQLAIELGTAREVISRTLNEFQHQGIVSLSRGKISNVNRSALQHIINQHLS